VKIDSDKYGSFNKTFREAAPYMGLGLQLAATIVIMILIGDWIDKKLELKYIFTIIFSILGISAGMYNLIKTINVIEKRKADNEKK
jgi:F0F1-type ATP synthase assembly protein I